MISATNILSHSQRISPTNILSLSADFNQRYTWRLTLFSAGGTNQRRLKSNFHVVPVSLTAADASNAAVRLRVTLILPPIERHMTPGVGKAPDVRTYS